MQFILITNIFFVERKHIKFIGSKLEAGGADICARIILKLCYGILTYILSEPLSLRVFRLHDEGLTVTKEVSTFQAGLMSQITSRTLLFSIKPLIALWFWFAFQWCLPQCIWFVDSWNCSYNIKSVATCNYWSEPPSCFIYRRWQEPPLTLLQ